MLFLLLAVNTEAQQTFIIEGKIEFERRMNVHKQMDDDSWGEMMKKTIPQFKTDYFNLYFNATKSLYKPGKESTDVKVPDWAAGPAFDNVVYTDLQKETFVSQKNIFETTFLIEDSLRKMDWKVTTDTRNIAGFECRKATTILMDSVYVIAFYTDQIVPTFGPESFTGLPGMILGLAVPRLNTTWFATRLEVTALKETDIIAPKKGKKSSIADLSKQLNAATKDWGNSSQRFQWKVNM